ncbi:MAG TPA: hypothetical protein VLJ38_19705 [Polyangiaceae bacterium]|nr:hypothetical protein [Polyangiaceae bacterium]
MTGDGHVWLRIAHQPLFSESFWLASRPFTLPLAYKLVGGSDEALLWLHGCFAVLSWVALAFAAAAFMETKLLAAIAFALVLGLGLSTPAVCWDVIVRSESIGLSAFLLCLAAVTFLAQNNELPERMGVAWAILAVIAALLTAFARETNAYLLPLLGVCSFWAVWAGAEARRLLRSGALALALVAVFLSCQANTRASGRYAFPLMNVIFERVLPNSRKLAYFRDALSMPVSRALLERRSHAASAEHRTAFHAPELAEFRAWVRERGYSAYQSYLLTHARTTFGEANHYFPTYARADFTRRGRAASVLDEVIVGGPTAAYPRLVLAITGVLGLLASFSRARHVRVLGVLSVFCVLATITQTFICYHGDAMETLRHGMMVGTMLRLSAVFAVLLGLAVAARSRGVRRA